MMLMRRVRSEIRKGERVEVAGFEGEKVEVVRCDSKVVRWEKLAVRWER